MVSSTIGELRSERKAIAAALAANPIADGWLFELHATASGQSAEARYLAIAHQCDLYVVVVAAQGSDATEAEYHAAYQDNPRKILPFFVGPHMPATEPFRNLIESRHTRVHRPDLSDLPTAVVDALRDQVRSGEIVRPPLTHMLDERLRRGEQTVTSGLPACFIPRLSPLLVPTEDDPRTQPLRASIVVEQEHQIVLEGIGGSGKTYGALTMLRHLSSKGPLPILVNPTRSILNILTLVTAAFEAARFFPGEALITQLARDGHFCVVVDGIDSLTSHDRRVFLEDLDEFAIRFPRCRVIACVRRTLPDELRQFKRFTVEPLSDAQTTDMFQSVDLTPMESFPPQVADLAQWPLWAWALIEVGPSVPTGLLLLRELLEHRIRRSGAYSDMEIEMLADAAAALALAAWPQPSITASDALATVAAWGTRSSVQARFEVLPAETLIVRLSAAGIVQQNPDIAFAHPLFATYLAARCAASTGSMSEAMAADPEFAMFVTAMLREDQMDEKLIHLAHHGPVGQARYLRLVAASVRERHPDDPVVFGSALKALSGSAAECIVTDSWTAWRSADEAAADAAEAVKEWMSVGDVNFMAGDAFTHRPPVDLAVIESLARFKDHVESQTPEGYRFDRLTDAQLKRLRRLPRDELNQLILQAVMDWRYEWRRQAADLRIGTLPEVTMGDGDPAVTISATWPDPGVQIEWAGTASVTWVQPDPDLPGWRFQPLSKFLDPGRDSRIYHELTERAERAIGCAFGSQAWNRPERVAAWAW